MNPVEASAEEQPRLTWRMADRVFARPQPVTIPMVTLFAIIPFYLVIGAFMSGRTVHVPEVAWDNMIPLHAAWSLVYLSLFLAALLPVFVVHQQELVRRTILAFLAIWLASFACFFAYPTIAPQHPRVIVESFSTWTLRTIWSSDIKYNCFPSLHVAQCFLAALICYRVHRGVGVVAGVWAFLVAMSTLYTKQHYVLDAIAGPILACAAYFAIVRGYPREAVPELERRLAPHLALGALAVYGLMVAVMWIAYANGVVV